MTNRCLAKCGPASAGPMLHNVTQDRSVPVILLLRRRANIDKPSNLLVLAQTKNVADPVTKGIPFGDPTGPISQRIRRKAEIKAGGAGRKHLLDLRHATIPVQPVDDPNNDWRAQKPLAFRLKPDF